MPNWTEQELNLINQSRTRYRLPGIISSACGEYFHEPTGRMAVVWNDVTKKGTISCLGRRSSVPEEMYGSAHCVDCQLQADNTKVEVEQINGGVIGIYYRAKLIKAA